MFTFLQRLKSMWSAPPAEDQPPPEPRGAPAAGPVARQDCHEDPLVGRYARTPQGCWWADVVLKNLDYEVVLNAPGPGPTADQIRNVEILTERLPGFLAEAELEPVFGSKIQLNEPYDLRTARIERIDIEPDGSFLLFFEAEKGHPQQPSPLLTISPRFELLLTEWTV